jgi:hypothetical protein
MSMSEAKSRKRVFTMRSQLGEADDDSSNFSDSSEEKIAPTSPAAPKRNRNASDHWDGADEQAPGNLARELVLREIDLTNHDMSLLKVLGSARFET